MDPISLWFATPDILNFLLTRIFLPRTQLLKWYFFFCHHRISQNSIRIHHKDHERYIYSSYCSVCYWSSSLGREFSGGGTADASIFVISSSASHPLIMLFYLKWLQILPRSYEKSYLMCMWNQSGKILQCSVHCTQLYGAMLRWMVLPISEEFWTWPDSFGRQQILYHQSPREQIAISSGLRIGNSLLFLCWIFWW